MRQKVPAGKQKQKEFAKRNIGPDRDSNPGPVTFQMLSIQAYNPKRQSLREC